MRRKDGGVDEDDCLISLLSRVRRYSWAHDGRTSIRAGPRVPPSWQKEGTEGPSVRRPLSDGTTSVNKIKYKIKTQTFAAAAAVVDAEAQPRITFHFAKIKEIK